MRDGGAELFSLLSSDKMHGNGSKLHQRRFRLDIRKHSFTNSMVKHRLPREVLDAPSPSVFKKHLDNALNFVSPELVRRLDQMIVVDHFQLKHRRLLQSTLKSKVGAPMQSSIRDATTISSQPRAKLAPSPLCGIDTTQVCVESTAVPTLACSLSDSPSVPHSAAKSASKDGSAFLCLFQCSMYHSPAVIWGSFLESERAVFPFDTG